MSVDELGLQKYDIEPIEAVQQEVDSELLRKNSMRKTKKLSSIRKQRDKS